MKVSLNIVKELVAAPLPPVSELVDMINAQLGGVEEVTDLSIRYKGARIVQVRSAEKHPDAERLTVCLVDDGGVVNEVERNEDGLVQVVCGAPNVRVGMWAVWLPPQSIVPSTFTDAEPFTLDARKLRGVMSYGMLAAGDELAINDDHEGIIEIQPEDVPAGVTLEVGESFAALFGLDDVVIEIENKMFTHRPDCFGQLGVAREIAAIVQRAAHDTSSVASIFKTPEWYTQNPLFTQSGARQLKVFNDASDAAPRFMAVVLENVVVGKSPLWLQCRLVALGSRPINSVVDMTNYLMLMSAQPTHAYDYDTLADGALGVRMAKQGESITLLNGKTYQLYEDDIVIADARQPVGLAGVMGGLATEVNDTTKTVVIEVANFDMYTVRKTSMRHGLFTDAVTRFSKGQSPLQTSLAMRYLINAVEGAQASPVYQAPEREVADSVHPPVKIDADFVNARLGSDFDVRALERILRSVDFDIQADEHDAGHVWVRAPFWRTDIEQPEDIVEEIGRLYGFDALKRELPSRKMQTIAKNLDRQTKQHIRNSLSAMGANEVLTYSFVHSNTLEKARQEPGRAYKISNALSPDLQYYRLSVLPSLLDKIHLNMKAGHEEFTLFEIGKGHDKQLPTTGEGLPSEQEYVDFAYVRKTPSTGAPYFYVRTIVAQLVNDLGARAVFTPITDLPDSPAAAPFEPSRSSVVATESGMQIGIIGELSARVRRGFKLPDYTAAATLNVEALKQLFIAKKSLYTPLSRFPAVERDVCFEVSVETTYAQLQQAIDAVKNTVSSVTISTHLIDIYQQPQHQDRKRCTFHFTLTPENKTLDGDEAATIIDTVVTYVQQQVDALVV